MQRERVEELQLLIGVEDVLVGRMLGVGRFESGLQSRLPFEFGGEHLVDTRAQLVGDDVQEDLVGQTVSTVVEPKRVHRGDQPTERVVLGVEGWRPSAGADDLGKRCRGEVIRQAGCRVLRRLDVELDPPLVMMLDDELHRLLWREANEHVVAKVSGQRSGERCVLSHGDHEVGVAVGRALDDHGRSTQTKSWI